MNTWFNHFGGMNLKSPHDSSMAPVYHSDNDNEVLFSAYYCALGGAFYPGIEAHPYFKEPGLQLRNPYRPNDSDSWDNQLGMMFLCKIYGLQAEITDIYSYGILHNWKYNNNPKIHADTFPLWRQPAQQYVIEMASNGSSYLMNARAFILSLCVCAFTKIGKESEIMTQFLANELVKECKPSLSIRIAMAIFYGIIQIRFGWINVFETYFKPSCPDHPIVKCARKFFTRR